MTLRTLRPLLVILALLLMQQLGMLHRYAHGPLGARSVATLQTEAGDIGSLPVHDATQCGLLDHLCTGDGAAPGAIFLVLALALGAAIIFYGVSYRGMPELAFQARAPPSLPFNR